MSNPFEYRDVMKASMRFGETRTVEEVIAEHDARRDARLNTLRSRQGPAPKTPAKRGAKREPPPLKTPTKGQLSALDALMKRAEEAKARVAANKKA